VNTNESIYNEEYLSGKADGTLSPEEQAVLDTMFAHDTALQENLQEIVHLKALLQKHRARLVAPIPDDVKRSVMQALQHEYAKEQVPISLAGGEESNPTEVQHVMPHRHSAPSLFDIVFGWLPEPRFAFATVLMVAIIGAGTWIGSRFISAPQQALQEKAVVPTVGFTDQALQNFSAVMAGKITLQKVTSSFDELEQFFHDKGVSYPLVRPKVQAVLAGGVVSEHDGVKLAHLVFECTDKSLLYMWQVPTKQLAPVHLQVASKTMDTLHTGEWLWQHKPTNETVALWEVQEKNVAIMCSMVSSLPQPKMMALFQ
jgi:hypothetical protein